MNGEPTIQARGASKCIRRYTPEAQASVSSGRQRSTDSACRFVPNCLLPTAYRLLIGLLPTAYWCAPCPADEIDVAIQALAQAGPQGQGAAAAAEACDLLADQDGTALPRLLAAMDTPNLVAANFARTAFEVVLARQLSQEHPALPLAEFKAFVLDSTHQGRVRRRILALVGEHEPAFPDQALAGFLEDPEFGEDAVALLLTQAEATLAQGQTAEALGQFQRAFDHALVPDQVTRLANRLGELGAPVSVAARLGLVLDWRVIGPFAAPGMTGFAQEFPPEDRVDLTALVTFGGGELAWQPYHSTDLLGQVDLNGALGATAEAVGYAYAEVFVERSQAAEIRCGADDNCTVWLNGQRVLGRDQWLNGSRFDRFGAPVTLSAGINRLLVKVCQGPQHKDPEVPNNWTFVLRLCDSRGAGLNLPPMPPAGGSEGESPPPPPTGPPPDAAPTPDGNGGAR